MTARPEVVLTMPARPEGVGVVRQALAGMADALDFEASVLADMKMAVTEACTNVVVHAYEEDSGVLEVEMLADEAGQGYVVCVGGSVEPGVQRILDITGLVPVLPVLQGRDEAIAAARSTNGSGE